MIPRNEPLPVIPDAVALQWANGKPVARPAGTSQRFAPHVGFHIEVGKDPELDAALGAAGYSQLEFRHQRQGGAEIVRHWSLGESIWFLPITAGPVASTITASLSNGNAKQTADAGIGLRWGEGEKSKLAVRGFVKGLWDAGYSRPVQLAVKSRMSDWLFDALLSHTQAAKAADALIDQAQYPDRQVSPAELWLPLVPGPETEFGRGETATVVPLMSGHPAAFDADYLRSLWRSKAIIERAIGLWPLVKAWALEFATTGGEEPVEPVTAESAAAADVPTDDAPASLFDDQVAERQPTADEVMASGGAAARRRRPTP